MMRTAFGTMVVVLTLTAAAAQPTAPVAANIPPVQRAERHFADGRAYLESLPEGTKVTLDRLDGTSFTLRLEGGLLKGRLPAAKLAADGTSWTSPLGYRLLADLSAPNTIVLEAPNGKRTTIALSGSRVLGIGSAGGSWWVWRENPLVIRLSDGTRIDMLDQGAAWEAITLGGERASLSLETRVWTSLPALPSPPLVPDLESAYPGGDGTRWRRPALEDHLVFAWNWYPVGIPLARVIEDVRLGRRRADLDGFAVQVPQPQAPVDAGAMLVARRFALWGGDRVTFEEPGKEPATVFLLPGANEPDYFPMREQLPKPRGGPIAAPSN